ncbi:MAG: hypothetical protein JWQ74_1741 [Marmoricola sp.]|nr:hypothetical protein [Marmoricola sp.]
MTNRERRVYRLLMTLGTLSLLAFYGWWFQPKHIAANFDGRLHLLDFAIFALLTGVVSLRIFMDVYLWVVARKIRKYRPVRLPMNDYKVAFITTFVPGAEGLDLLAKTLPAMLAADYPHDVWLLDEGADDDAKALAESLGVHYFTRCGKREYNLVAGPFTRRTKGGNHNAWYDRHGRDYDIVAQIDTDFLPRRDFLTQTLGHFDDPGVGWVVTPQIYGNTDNFVSLGAAQQQYTFYGPVLQGLAGRGMANLLGANHVIRVRALEEVGLYAGHITEDLITGMRMHALGWRSEYVPLPLAIGEGPDTWRAYFNQQMRWAYGCMDILRHHSGDLVRKMPVNWRALYVSIQQGYFSGVAAATGLGLLAAYFLGGVQISRMSLTELLIWASPLFVSRQLFRFWLQRYNVRPKAEGGVQIAGALIGMVVWPIYLLAFIRVIRSQPLVFKVTPKGAGRTGSGNGWSTFRPHMLWLLLALASFGGAFYFDRWSPVLTFWLGANVALLGSFCLAGPLLQVYWNRPQRSRRRRAAVLSAQEPYVPAEAAWTFSELPLPEPREWQPRSRPAPVGVIGTKATQTGTTIEQPVRGQRKQSAAMVRDARKRAAQDARAERRNGSKLSAVDADVVDEVALGSSRVS